MLWSQCKKCKKDVRKKERNQSGFSDSENEGYKMLTKRTVLSRKKKNKKKEP